MAPYQYSPLNEEAGEIRLVTLHPGPLNPEIYVALQNETLAKTNAPVFGALSYTWGSMENLHDIHVGPSGNDVLSVTRNLAVALPYLQYAEKVRVLWSNAMCIDQKNTNLHDEAFLGPLHRKYRPIFIFDNASKDVTLKPL